MTHSFQRYTAAGNTFVVMNTWEDPLSLSREGMRVLVQKACDYKNGIGADGMILINQSGLAADFRMDFYNPDGSTGMLCGNGARCAAQAAKDYGFADSDRAAFEVLGAINTAEFLPNGSIRVYFQDPSVIRLNFELPIEDGQNAMANYIENGQNIIASYVDLGSQHVVVFHDAFVGVLDIEEMNIAFFGPLLRWNPEFAPVGANANFIEVREDGEEQYLRIRTFERGVEGETLACGTGCMSAAIVARMTSRITKKDDRSSAPIRLLTQSGEFVTVNFSLAGSHVSNLSLEGPVVPGEAGTLTFQEETQQFDVEYL
ncbi:MAG TPA: diaminopimelate epimerase [Candidatus Kapabacteria bacterium]|nr:diaminopimelate epimerase [Candidatus Kapabacteria bacterium]